MNEIEENTKLRENEICFHLIEKFNKKMIKSELNSNCVFCGCDDAVDAPCVEQLCS